MEREKEKTLFIVGAHCIKIYFIFFFVSNEKNGQREKELISVICCHHLQTWLQHLWKSELNPPISLLPALVPSTVINMSKQQES